MKQSTITTPSSPTIRKIPLPLVCRDCGAPLIGSYKFRAHTPYHIECAKCMKHYDHLLIPPDPMPA